MDSFRPDHSADSLTLGDGLDPDRAESSEAGASNDGGAVDSDAASAGCPVSLDFDDGSAVGLAFGPSNHVLAELGPSSDTVKTYNGQTIYASGTLKATGVFETGVPPPGNLGPSDGVALARWLGEIALVPPRCRGVDIANKIVTVHFFLPLTGAVGTRPPNGAFLGSYHGSVMEMTSYSDAVISDLLNTTSEVILAHRFTQQESADVVSDGLYLRIYVLGDAPIALYVDRITWQ